MTQKVKSVKDYKKQKELKKEKKQLLLPGCSQDLFPEKSCSYFDGFSQVEQHQLREHILT